jgi:DEAD/DEAH box helicase domain-containing protein
MCDPRDLAMVVDDQPTSDAEVAEGTFAPTLHLYDAYPGGIGLAPRIFEQHETLLRRARVLIEGCTCEHGCPTCVGPQMTVVPTQSRRATALRLLLAIGIESLHPVGYREARH